MSIGQPFETVFTRNRNVSKTFTHVQYKQTDTIRQIDGPLVPMVELVPIENNVIPMVLLVNMHLIKGTWPIEPMK